MRTLKSRHHLRFFLRVGHRPGMGLWKITFFSLYHVIVRPTKIIKDLCKAIHKRHLCTGFTKVLNNFGSSDNDMF